MKRKLESILNKGKMIALAGVAFLTIGCASLKHYLEPRVGVISPVTEKEQAYDPSFLIGTAYGLNMKKIGLEVGLDYFHSSGKYIETDSLLPRINVSYYPLKPIELDILNKSKTVKIKPYLMGGMNLLNEFSTINIPEFDVQDNISNRTFGLEFGIGATIQDRIHARLSYTAMPTSENVKGMITLTGGYRFLTGNKK